MIGIWSKFLEDISPGEMINDKQKLSLKTCHNKSFFTFITLTLSAIGNQTILSFCKFD